MDYIIYIYIGIGVFGSPANIPPSTASTSSLSLSDTASMIVAEIGRVVPTVWLSTAVSEGNNIDPASMTVAEVGRGVSTVWLSTAVSEGNNMSAVQIQTRLKTLCHSYYDCFVAQLVEAFIRADIRAVDGYGKVDNTKVY